VIVRYLTASLAGAFNALTGWAGSNSVLDPSCLVAPGIDEYVDFGNLTPCNFGVGPFTVRQWVKIDVAPTVSATPLISKMNGVQGWSLRITNALKMQGYVASGTSFYRIQTGTTTLELGHWYHVTMVYEGSGGDIQLYLGGVREDTTPEGAVGAWNTSNTGSLKLFREFT
jgi:hypothetical protein